MSCTWVKCVYAVARLYRFRTHRPFLEFRPVSGSFQANPPYCEELIEAALLHIERLLSDTIEPLRYVRKNARCSREMNLMERLYFCSFIVFLPEWKEPTLPCIARIEESPFKRKSVVVPGMAHEYRHGYQHILPK